MKFYLLLSLAIAVNTAVSKTVLPWKEECYMSDIETDEQSDCSERNGYYYQSAPINEEGDCPTKYACFLPSGAKKILPDAIKAQDPSECIEIGGRYYCSADLNNIPCENCTFPEFVQKAYETFGGRFQYEEIDVSKVKTPIELPTDTAEKIKCAKQESIDGKCRDRGGYYLNMSFYPDCDKDYYACFLPNNKKILKNSIAAKNLSECIIIDDEEYCSIDYTNISCPEGKECTYPELLKEISNIFGDYFSYEKSSTTSTEAVSNPEKEFCYVRNYQYYSEERNCDDRDGVYAHGSVLNDDGKCDYKYACFLPSGVTRLFPDAFKAEDPSECIDINGDVYCSADLNNIECPDCTFPQFVERVKEVLDQEFYYKAVDVSEVTESIVLPKDVIPQNVECAKRKPLPEKPYRACRNVGGELFNMEFHPDCEKTYYACFIPRDGVPKKTAIKAKYLSECITITVIGHPNVYCAVDYYDGVTCPEGKETCTFTEYVQEMSRIYGDYFDYAPYIPKDNEDYTDAVTDYIEDNSDIVTDYAEDYTDVVIDYSEYFTDAVTDYTEDYTEDYIEDYIED